MLDLGKNIITLLYFMCFATFKQNTLAQYCYSALRLYFFLLETGKVFVKSERVILSRFSTQTLQLGYRWGSYQAQAFTLGYSLNLTGNPSLSLLDRSFKTVRYNWE